MNTGNWAPPKTDTNYGYSKADAKRAEDEGYPALLPDGNRWKNAALDHRYGKHHDGCPNYCPQYGTDKAKIHEPVA